MQEETWKDVPNYEGLYQVSNLGRIKSLPRFVIRKNNKMFVGEKILKPYSKSSSGYFSVPLSKCGIRHVKDIHRIVAETFLPYPQQLRDVNHKDGDKTNNNVSNLEWCTHSQNIKHSYNTLKHRHVYRNVLCLENGIVYKSSVEAAEALGLDDSLIRLNANRGTGSVCGYHFKNLKKITI